MARSGYHGGPRVVPDGVPLHRSGKAIPPTGRCAAQPAPDPGACSGARLAAVPTKIDAELATLEDAAPEGDAWLHEVKFDGYRILAHIAGGRARLISRNQLDWTNRFRRIAEALPAAV